ncbi:hypothetical protein RRU94_18635 [Domibacillus sp. DTU_2020_1001157_1_SI_ALB_TIR_016]|uniref:hypothetical protein n=1 Tax=Domibacillus sp. DTU_2020_1001157_1_SI_ALB_TIR_016 TaxID=3077789 RepID=UPI0028E973AC|nr:hypothetical protein [Domibacillus sp. DTU_2020_1001157_1_SI_ALB_TIR_016]WNS79546.1 hypothetical protein RRU94_18635 [Domibacillus sp. DTU_2020_1001157_1_SI_ALB_TIR_016]
MLSMEVVKSFNTSYSFAVSDDFNFISRVSNKTFIYLNKNWEDPIVLNKPSHPGTLEYNDGSKLLLIQNTTGSTYIYETEQFNLVKTIRSKKNLKLKEGQISFLKEKTGLLFVASTSSSDQIFVFDLDLDQYEAISDFEDSSISYIQYLEEENAHLFTIRTNNEMAGVTEFSIVKIVEKDFSFIKIDNSKGFVWKGVLFNAALNSYILVDGYNVVMLDSKFENVLQDVKLSLPEVHGFAQQFRHIILSNDGKFILITFSECVVILDSKSLNAIDIQDLPNACYASFSKDDKYLLIGTWNKGYILLNNL